MNITTTTGMTPTREPQTAPVSMKLEAVVIPVADPDRAKRPYEKLGWRLDADFAFDNGFRLLQFTPLGSGASIQFGANIVAAAPGSARGQYLIVSGIQAAHDQLTNLGIKLSDVFHPGEPDAQCASDGTGRVSGLAPDRATYGSFATFTDPDNEWLVQEVTERLPGRRDVAQTASASTANRNGSC